MTTKFLLLFSTLGAAIAPAQNEAIFPDEYEAVAEGPFDSPRVPFARGISRVMFVYEAVDIAVPTGNQITRIGFREDGTLTAMDPGRVLQLEIRMGYTTETAATISGTFATQYSGTPVTVFGPAMLTLPNLRDSANPLPNGQFFVPFSTPFQYDPSQGNLLVEYLVYGNNAGGAPWNYRLDRADYYATRNYGPGGCQHSGGQTPTLTIANMRPGSNYSTTLASAPQSAFAVLSIVPGAQLVAPYSLQNLVPGIAPTCTGQIPLVGNLPLTGLTSASGAKTWTFAIPNDPSFADFRFASQAAVFDFFAPGGAVVSPGGEVTVGVSPRCSVVVGVGPPITTPSGTVTRNYCPVTFFTHQ
ncbi:MAG: hypothetical protein KDE27_32520 [Planctomycetes bacterium]|nr:hypothetical protein [Planctomycetota bacterium]